ncbi:MAG TPA: TRAP transporter substrate-binding protein DctP [Smithellaceae bacterium]|nr:TRAP transporter substrate-binding protein DctP [Smithellaceae bacterium]HRS88103.1 TRAP transporter substrate-binding protein DctP [Smithellaceae bacterium]HRV25423.1 TRAP transporter substrate-binding protein DctP [Smithellaceae bacterium]
MKKFSVVVIFIVAVFCLIGAFFASTASAQVIKWRMLSCWPAQSSLWQAATRLSKNIYELSGGRLQITCHPAGEIVPAAGVFDAVSRGAAEMGQDWATYWAGKNSAFDLLGSFPMTLSQHDMINWFIHGEGREMFNYMYGKYNMIYFINGITPVGSGIRSRMPLKSLDDLRGKKIRMSGKAAGYILQKVGAVQVLTPAAEISQALAMGVIDGASFNTPNVDMSLGMTEVTKFCLSPGWNMPSASGGIMINKDAWNSLTPDLKKIVEIAIAESNHYFTALADWDNANALKSFAAKGLVVHRLSEKELRQIEQWTYEYIEEEAKKNPDFDKVATSMFNFLKEYAPIRDYQVPYEHGRNPLSYPKLRNLK